MAEQINKTEIVPAPLSGEYMVELREVQRDGSISKFGVAVPSTVNSMEASVMLRAAILKRTTWKDFDFPTVLHAVIYADRMGLDIMAGDVYMANEGRLSTTAGAKIRHAMGTGRIAGYKVTIEESKDQISIPYTVGGKACKFEGPELIATVEVSVTGWKEPVVYKTRLSEWFTGRNPNWTTRPEYMLRRNALSKALEEVAPLGVEADEAPPLVESTLTDAKAAVAAAKTQVESEKISKEK